MGFALRENSFFESLGKIRPDIHQIMSYYIDNTQREGVFKNLLIRGNFNWSH
jgi:hypothetical protein